MLENALWKNPVGWTNRYVGTKLRFYTTISFHIFYGLMIGFAFLAFMGLKAIGLAFAIAVIATIFPVYYLIALKYLLQKLETNK